MEENSHELQHEVEHAFFQTPEQHLDHKRQAQTPGHMESEKPNGSFSGWHLYETRGELREEMERLRQECYIADTFVKNIGVAPDASSPRTPPAVVDFSNPLASRATSSADASAPLAFSACENASVSGSFERQRELLKSWDDVMEKLFPLMHQLLTLPESPSAQRQASICEQLLRENRHRMGPPKALLQMMESLTEALSLWQQDTRDRIMMLDASLSQLRQQNQEGLERAYESMKRKNERLERLEWLETENAELRDKLYIAERKMSLHHSLQAFSGVRQLGTGSPSARRSSARRTTSSERFTTRKPDDVRPLYSLPQSTRRRTRSTRHTLSESRIEKTSMHERFDADSIYYR